MIINMNVHKYTRIVHELLCNRQAFFNYHKFIGLMENK